MRKLFAIFVLILITSSCNKDEVIVSTPPPVIRLDNPSGIYTVKVGREVVMAPSYENAEEAAFEWSIAGEVVCTEPSYAFVPDRTGEIFVMLTVTTDYGSDSEELRVDVLELEIPTVSIFDAAEGYTIVQHGSLELTAAVRECSIPTALSWQVNGEEVSQELTYTFVGDELGEYALSFSAENEDGSDSVEFTIRVCTAEEMPFTWSFDRTAYHMASGRRVRIAPTGITGGETAEYRWAIDGVTVEGVTQPEFVFDRTEEGKYLLTLTADIRQTEGVFTMSQAFEVEVFPAEGRFKRPKSAASVASQTIVFEYTPAPGQFINELKTSGFTGTETTPEAAVAYAKSRMESSLFVSLGGFGGYIVVGFDHSIDNTGDYDFAIKGNSFDGSSEPGIVWVMQDENGNGEPDDTWYELKGCEEGHPATIKDYAVTYYRPAGVGMPVQWQDNLGASGEIDYLKAFHTQDYYYPAWIEADSYTLRGTRLEARNYDQSGNGTYWVQPSYDWGYADNFSPIDRLTEDDNASAAANPNHFKISNAIDWEGKAVELGYIDFVKVQTALNTKSGWLGENSTEVFGFFDYSMQK